MKKLVLGENYMDNKGESSIHSEVDATSKLNSHIVRKIKKSESINFLVIRFSKTGIIGSSRPCYHCLVKTEMMLKKKKINLKYVYYSKDDGTIVREKYTEMKNSNQTYISSGNRK